MRQTADHEHTRQAIHKRLAEGPRQSYLRDWVYGGIDGAVTTFALVSGVVGAHLAPNVILVLGGASLFADGFAMAAGNYLATRSEHEEFAFAKRSSGGTSTSSPKEKRKRCGKSCAGWECWTKCSSRCWDRSPPIGTAG